MIYLPKATFALCYYSKMLVYRKKKKTAKKNRLDPRTQYKTSLSFVVIYQGQVTFKWPSALSEIGLERIEHTHNIHRVASRARDSFINQLHINKRHTATQTFSNLSVIINVVLWIMLFFLFLF